jgi:hypothetical protein
MIKKILRSGGLAALIGCVIVGSVTLRAQTAAEDFEDGSLSPFNVEKLSANISEIITPSGFSARAGSKVHHIKWFQSNYDGTRTGRSVEGTSSSQTRITADGWYGFSFYAPESFPVPGKQMVLGQIICWHPSLPSTNITITLGVEPSGRFVLEGAYGVGDGGKTVTVYTTLSPLLTKGSWHDVVIYCKFSKINTGVLKVWLDGAPESAPTAHFTGINLGNGAWSGNELMTNGGYIKWGPYCWDYANYDSGETREIYYDEIAYEVGNTSGAFDRVKPAGYGTGYAAPAPGATVMAETYDGMTTGTQPAGWTISLVSGSALTVREIPSATDKCMQFWDSNATGHPEAYKTFAPQGGRVTASWSFRQNGQGEGHCMAVLSGTLPAVELYTIGGNLVYRDGAGTDHVLQAIPYNTWYDVEVDMNPFTFTADVYVGGVRKLTGATYRNPTTTIDRIRFGTSDASATWHLYVNDVVVSRAPVVFSENFNAMTTGTAPAGWTRAANTSLTVREVPSATDKCMQFYDASATTHGEAFNTFVPQSSRVAVSWSFKQNGTAEGHRMALMSGASVTAVEVLTSGGNLVYKNGAGTNVTIQAIPANTWYDVKVVMNPATTLADVYVNGVLKLGNQSLRTPVTFVDRVLFATSDASATYHFYVDNVLVTRAEDEPLAMLAGGIPRVPIILKLDDLNTGGGNVPNTWRRVTNFTTARNIKCSVGLIAKSLEIGTSSYLSYITGLHSGGLAEIWFHGYDHSSSEFSGKTYTDQKNRFVTSQSLAMTKLGFHFEAFGAPENLFDANTVQVMSEDSDMKVWLYGDPAQSAGKTVLTRVGDVNIEQPTFVPNPEKFASGYLANYSGRQYFVVQGHPANWTDARWYEFVRLIDWLQANGFTFTTPQELAASL